MDIKEIALKLAIDNGAYCPKGLPSDWDDGDLIISPQQLEKFSEALIAELAKGNEPVYYLWENKFGDPQQMLSSNSGPHPEYVITPLYTIPPSASQIEQETAEAMKNIENILLSGESGGPR